MKPRAADSSLSVDQAHVDASPSSGAGQSFDAAVGQSRVGHDAINWGPPWIGPVHHRTRIDLQWLMIAGLMLAAGLVFFGWRGLFGVCTTALATVLAYGLLAFGLKFVRPYIMLESNLHALVLGVLLGLTLPAGYGSACYWVSGLLMGIVAHVVGRSHRLRIHPVVAALVLIWLLGTIWGLKGLDIATGSLRGAVLRSDRVVVGDLSDVTKQVDPQAWLKVRKSSQGDAILRFEPSALLKTCQRKILLDRSMLGQLLGTGQLICMSDLVLGAVPGPIGGSSRAWLIALGMYLMYRRLSWWPMAVVALVTSLITLLVMPLPGHGPTARVLTCLMDMGVAPAITYVAYTILASPMTLILMILAPQTAPTSTDGKLVYGMIVGAGTIIAQWFCAEPFAPYLGLLIGGVLSRPLDALHKGPFVQ